jgi:hypothetical protein
LKSKVKSAGLKYQNFKNHEKKEKDEREGQRLT